MIYVRNYNIPAFMIKSAAIDSIYDPSNYTDRYLNELNMALSLSNIISFHGNSNYSSYTDPFYNFGVWTEIGGGYGSASSNLNPFGNEQPNTVSGNQASDDLSGGSSNDYSAQFNTKLSLIEKYCAKYGNIADVDNIRKEYANDPEAGIAYCDDILNNKFDQEKLKDIVNDMYQENIDGHIANGNAISELWIKEANENGLETPSFAVSGINTDNILDVIGTFITNDDVKNGKVKLENVFENPQSAAKLVDAMKGKADYFLLHKDVDSSTKEKIKTQIATMQTAYDAFKKDSNMSKRKELVKAFTDIFKTLRLEQAQKNDAAAAQHYGLPEESEIEFTNFLDRANEEINASNNSKTLNTTI